MAKIDLSMSKWFLAITASSLLSSLAPLEVRAGFDAELEGRNVGGTTWVDNNLMGWRELDYIPCRVDLRDGPATARVITVEFDHLRGRIRGIENLTGWTTSTNVVITSPPVLTAPPGAGTWYYTFTINLLNSRDGFVEFRARLSAGAHLNTGSSLALGGTPSLGNLQIHKPGPGLGLPDLCLVKHGPASAAPGEIITYTLNWTNKNTTTLPSVGVQVTDILPPQLDFVTNSATGGAVLVGNSLIWDLGNLPVGAVGSMTYRARVRPGTAFGSTFRNYAQILSSENDLNPADNISVVTTTVAFNRAPVANNDSYSINEDSVLTVPAAGVLANDSDPDGNAITVGTPRPVTGPANGTLTLNANGSFTYTPNANFNGTDSFRYVATDGMATSAVASVSITVNPVNDAPTANHDVFTVDEDMPLTIPLPGVLANDTDVDSAVLTALLVSGPSQGTLALNANGGFVYTPALNFNGPDTFTYRASDGVAMSSPATVTINVRPINDPPVARADAYTTDEDTALSVAVPGVLANDSDMDSPVLTAILVTGPAQGTLTLQANGSFLYTPAANYHGSDSFTYKASDGFSDSSTVTVTFAVRPVNDAPVAANDTYATDEDVTLTIAAPGVLANDSDVDSLVLTASLVAGPAHGVLTLQANGGFVYVPAANYHGPVSFTYKALDGATNSATATVTITVRPVNDAPVARHDTYTTPEDTTLNVPAPGVLGNDEDPDRDTLTAILVAGPAHGTLTLHANGGFLYTPATNYHGPDSFIYKANDGLTNSGTATANFTVTAMNDRPVALDDAYATDEDSAVTIIGPGVMLNDSDIDGDALTAQLVSGPTRGTVVLNADGGFTYAPAANYHGSDSFSYRVTDGGLFSLPATVRFTVRPVNDLPVANADSYAVDEDVALSIAPAGVLTNDMDIDGDALTAVLFSSPAHGTLALNANGGFIYTPAPNYHGPDSFSYMANDGVLNSAPALVSVTVRPRNDRPMANHDSYSTDEDVTLVIATPGVLGNDLDIDGDSLTASLVSGPSHGTLSLSPGGGFTYLPRLEFSGTDSFTYQANDGTTSSAPATVTLNVGAMNDAPVANSDRYTATEDTTLTIAAPGVLANDLDPDGDTLTASLVTAPAHGTLTLNPNGSFTYRPATNYQGPDSFTYRAVDGATNSATATVTITVAPVNDAPIAVNDSHVTNEDTALVVAAPGVLGNDLDVDGDTLRAVLVSGPSQGTLTLSSNGGFAYTPAANYHGADSFTYKATDGSAEATATVTLTILPVNDAPAFTKGPNPLVMMNSGASTVSGWATGLSAGPANESSQTLSFQITGNSRPTLFATAPSVAADGTLRFTPAANSFGVATITLRVRDNGGIERGGVDASAEQTFTITVNSPPTVTITSPTNGSVFLAPITSLSLMADAFDADGSVTNLEVFVGADLLVRSALAPILHPLMDLRGGVHTFIAIATDNLGARSTSAPVTITITEIVPLEIVQNLHLDLQSGLFKESVRVRNLTTATWPGLRLLIKNLPTNATVWNASGQSNGTPYVQIDRPVPPGSNLVFTIEYYVPTRVAPSSRILEAEIARTPLPPVNPNGAQLAVDRQLRLANGDFLIEWVPIVGRTYFVQYTSDLRTWKTAIPSVLGTGIRQQWIDSGPPKTESRPDTGTTRFYRLLMIP